MTPLNWKNFNNGIISGKFFHILYKKKFVGSGIL